MRGFASDILHIKTWRESPRDFMSFSCCTNPATANLQTCCLIKKTKLKCVLLLYHYLGFLLLAAQRTWLTEVPKSSPPERLPNDCLSSESGTACPTPTYLSPARLPKRHQETEPNHHPASFPGLCSHYSVCRESQSPVLHGLLSPLCPAQITLAVP